MSVYYRTSRVSLKAEMVEINNYPPPYIPAVGTSIRFTLANGRLVDLDVYRVVYDVATRSTRIELHPREGE